MQQVDLLPIEDQPPEFKESTSGLLGEWKVLELLNYGNQGINPGSYLSSIEISSYKKIFLLDSDSKVVFSKDKLLIDLGDIPNGGTTEYRYTLSSGGKIIIQEITNNPVPNIFYGKLLAKGNQLRLALNFEPGSTESPSLIDQSTSLKDAEQHVQYFVLVRAGSVLIKTPPSEIKGKPSGLLGEWTVRFRTYSHQNYLPPGIIKTSEDTPLPKKLTELDNAIKIVIDKEHLWFEMLPAEKTITKYPYTLKPNGDLVLHEIKGSPEQKEHLGKFLLKGDDLRLSFRMEEGTKHPKYTSLNDVDSQEHSAERNVQYFSLERTASSTEANQPLENSILGQWRVIDFRGENPPALSEKFSLYIDKQHLFFEIQGQDDVFVYKYQVKSEGNIELHLDSAVKSLVGKEPPRLVKFLVKGNRLWWAEDLKVDAALYPNDATGAVPQPDVNYVTFERVNPLPVTAGTAPPKPKRIK